jgi:hypothetical protein
MLSKLYDICSKSEKTWLMIASSKSVEWYRMEFAVGWTDIYNPIHTRPLEPFKSTYCFWVSQKCQQIEACEYTMTSKMYIED